MYQSFLQLIVKRSRKWGVLFAYVELNKARLQAT